MELYVCVLGDDCEQDKKQELERCQNELLDVYSLYLNTGIQSIREEVIHRAFELHVLDPDFQFVI